MFSKCIRQWKIRYKNQCKNLFTLSNLYYKFSKNQPGSLQNTREF